MYEIYLIINMLIYNTILTVLLPLKFSNPIEFTSKLWANQNWGFNKIWKVENIYSDLNGFSLFLHYSAETYANSQHMFLKKNQNKNFITTYCVLGYLSFSARQLKKYCTAFGLLLLNKKRRDIPNDSLPPFCILTCKHSQ